MLIYSNYKIQVGFCRNCWAAGSKLSVLKYSFVQEVLVTASCNIMLCFSIKICSYICIWSRASIVLSLFLIFGQIWASLFLSIRSTWPIHFHHLVLTSLLTRLVSVLSFRSSLEITHGHRIFRILLMQVQGPRSRGAGGLHVPLPIFLKL